MDYVSAMSRVSEELEKLTEELWPDVIGSSKWCKEHEETVNDKVQMIYFSLYCIKDDFKRKKFNMFYNLKDKCYWHATDSWQEIRKTLTDDEESLYAAIMLEQAKNDTRSGILGPLWIVQSYDNENLKNFISDDLLNESVNKGFWKLVNENFTNERDKLPFEAYDTLMKYSEKLDLKQVNEFKTRPILARLDSGSWIDDNYLSAFERARSELDKESGAWLARPIIERAITAALSSRNESNNPKDLIEKHLENYKEYLDSALIQKLLKEEVEWRIKNIDIGNAFWHIRNTEILKKYLNLPTAAFQEFISSNLDIKEEELRVVVGENFPKEWLTSWKLSELKEKIMAYIDAPSGKGDKKEIIPNLAFLNNALITGYLELDIGRKIIESKLSDYLTKSRISSQAVESLLISLKPKYVSEALYRKVVHIGIGQMANSKRTIQSAYEWYEKAKNENWLDESEIPIPKLERIEEYSKYIREIKEKEAEERRSRELMKVFYHPRRKHGIARLRKSKKKRPESSKSKLCVQQELSDYSLE